MNTIIPLRNVGLIRPLIVTGLVALCAGSVIAQTLPNAGQLLNEIQKSDRESLPRTATPDLIQETAPRAAIKLPEGAQVDVARFRVTGNKAFSGDLLGSLVKPWEGRVLDVNGLNDAAGAITRHYQTKGFLLAYAYLPVQKIEQGVIEIAVLEGTVDSVQIVTAQDVRLNDEVIQKYVEGITQTPQVMQSDLERRLLLLNDIPGVVARASFAPGARPGTADVIVTVAEEDPLAYSVDFNNQGSESTGEYRMGALFQFKNLFGLGDSTRLRLQTSPRISLASGSLNTRVPLGGQGWSAEAGVSRLSYTLSAPYDSLGARGEANTVHLGFTYALARGFDENISLAAGYDYKDLADVLDLIGSNNKKHSQQVSLSLNATSRTPWLDGGATQSVVTYSAGTLDWDSAPSSGAAAGSFGKISFDASHRQTLLPNWSASVRFTGQQAFDNLDSSEKYALTGPYGVRAYAPGQASVDSASVIALELRRAWALSGGTFSGSLFYDFARGEFAAHPSNSGDNDITLSGYGLGLGWANGADLDFSITAAWRNSHMLTASTDRSPYIYFQVTKGF